MRIKCGYCAKESKGRCSVLRATVKPNKTRKCDYYEQDNAKELLRLERKAISMDNQDAAYQRRLAAQAAMRKAAEAKAQEATAHPVTGDLSRFKSSAPAKDEENTVTENNNVGETN